MKIRIPVLLATLLLSLSGFSQQKNVIIEPAPDWVTPVLFDADATPPSGQESGYYYLVIDEQENTAREERYLHFVYKVLTSDGVQAMSDISLDFDPSYQDLILHRAHVHRDGKVIDQTSNHIQTIQREQSMDRYLYDGSITAVLNLTDIRTGDIIEFDYTRRGYNPVYENHVFRKFHFNFTVPYEKFYQRLIVPESTALQMEYRNIDIEAEVKTRDGKREYVWSLPQTRALVLDDYTPVWFEPNQAVMLSDFESWGEVAAWAEKHFRVTADERKALAERIKEPLGEHEGRAFVREAVRFVQDEIRYLGFESGLNSHKPHPPVTVFDQRFGDCKDKSLLLCEILRSRGVEASPVLVSTSQGRLIPNEPPGISAFNHCVVQIRIDGKPYFVDPTINNQGGRLEDLYFPPYGTGLVVDASTTALTPLPAPVAYHVSEVQTISVPSLEAEAYLHVETTYTGKEADRLRGEFQNNTLESIQKNYLTYYANLYPELEVANPMTTDDDKVNNIFTVDETYKIPQFWQPGEAEDQVFAEVYPQTMETYFNVSKSSQRTAPYGLSYPLSYDHTIHIKLPEEWTVETDEEIIDTDYYNYAHFVTYADRQITLQTSYETKTDNVPVEAFEKFVSDHEKMMENLPFQISYNKALMANEQGISWLGVISGLATLGLGLWLMLRIYYYYDPQPTAHARVDGEPIGGWLILPAIGLLLTPFRLLYDLYHMPEVYDSQTWAGLWALERYALAAFVMFEHIYNILYLLFAVLVATLFFKRRSSVPRLISIFYGVGCLVVTFDTVVGSQLDAANEAGYYKQMVQSIIAAIIWIPYFNMSTRVKDTFVKRVNDDDRDLEPAPAAEEAYPLPPDRNLAG